MAFSIVKNEKWGYWFYKVEMKCMKENIQTMAWKKDQKLFSNISHVQFYIKF